MRLRIRATQEKVEPIECEIKFRCRTDGSLQRMLDLFTGEKRGILAFDPTEPFDDGTVRAVAITPGIDLKYSILEGSKNDKETISTIVIRVEPKEFDSKEQLKKRLDRYKCQVLQVIKALGDLGNQGHSFGIYFYPENKQANIEEFGWDGDGSDYIFMEDLEDEFKNLEKK